MPSQNQSCENWEQLSPISDFSLFSFFSHGLLCKTWIVPPVCRYWFMHIYIYIYIFICLFYYLFSSFTFFTKCYSSVSCEPILMKLGMLNSEVLGYLKTASLCLYCLYKQSYSCLYITIYIVKTVFAAASAMITWLWRSNWNDTQWFS